MLQKWELFLAKAKHCSFTDEALSMNYSTWKKNTCAPCLLEFIKIAMHTRRIWSDGEEKMEVPTSFLSVSKFHMWPSKLYDPINNELR